MRLFILRFIGFKLDKVAVHIAKQTILKSLQIKINIQCYYLNSECFKLSSSIKLTY